MSTFKFTGCVLLVTSCMIGGGILALPLIAYEFGLTLTYIFMIFAYTIMLISGLLTLEICLKLPKNKNNFGSIAEHSFGKAGKYIVIIIAAIALYTVITAYISASPAIFKNTFLFNINIPFEQAVLSLAFTIILGFIIICGIKYADKLNRIIMGFKLIVLFIALFLILFKMPFFHGFDIRSFQNFSEGFSIILFVFSYQAIIPSLANYVGEEKTIYTKWIIITAVSLTFIATTLWVTIVVSIIQPYSNEVGARLSLNELLTVLSHYNFGDTTNLLLKMFFNITLISSFIGLSIAFIDIWVDSLKFEPKFSNRLIGGLIVYIPCWIVANFDPNIFVTASAISGYCGLFVALLLPSIVSFKEYKKQETIIIGGKFLRATMIIISLAVLITIVMKI
ncbi:hypothetical protein LO80_00135 [Candidatus Francisella endociliophora]|uniref:Amino acid transporter n=1 Tax=Candidatus Francisella endociliophora TaxID=653937 RepID=A0A097ELT3_9GAMM|nr:aromatic amino acid transport family protein [Francisella sp. FSC1006]AIT08534.1 hypothetical protein LO80_00135 [Francisella sp. FSC1006]